MIGAACRVLIASGACAAASAQPATKEDAITDDEVVIRQADGHNLLLPRDWPVEHKNGVVSPVSVEQYLSMKFDQVRERFAQTDQRFDQLSRRLEQVELEQKLAQKRLRILEERPLPAEHATAPPSGSPPDAAGQSAAPEPQGDAPPGTP